MATIKLAPEELKSQAAEMAALQKEYEAFFSGVTSTLKNVNQSWSANLSHNFSGKITAAQRSFQNVTALLGQGAEAAQTSAGNFANLDSQLAKIMDGVSDEIQSKSTETPVNENTKEDQTNKKKSTKDSKKKKVTTDDFLEYLKESYRESGESVKYLEKEYAKLPKYVRDFIEEMAGNDMQAALKITGDIVKGEISLDTLSSYLGAIEMDSMEASAVVKTVDKILNQKGNLGELMRGADYFKDRAWDCAGEGDWGNALKYFGAECGVGLFTLAYGPLDIMTDIIGDMAGSSADKAASTLNLLGNIVPGEGGYVLCDLSKGVDTVGSTLKSIFNNLM